MDMYGFLCHRNGVLAANDVKEMCVTMARVKYELVFEKATNKKKKDSMKQLLTNAVVM